MISKGIVPIIITYTYRTDAAFNLLVDRYNTALVAVRADEEAAVDRLEQGNAGPSAVLAVAGTIPVGRRPLHARQRRRIPSTSDPYANGGDPATHTTGLALTYNGYGLKGWLGVQKMKEIKQLVIDGVSPAAADGHDERLARLDHVGAASTLTWSSTNATTVSINQGIGTVAASGTRSVSPTATTTYTVTATNAAGSVTATATVTVSAAPTLPTVA